jgi:hypothetical protein
MCYTLAFSVRASLVLADSVTNGAAGISIPTIGLDGSNIDIGQIEENRPGDPDFDTNPSLYNSSVNPAQVYWRMPGTPTTFNASNGPDASFEVSLDHHATKVAGILISTDAGLKGIAPAANLYSIGDNGIGPDYDPVTAESIQFIIDLLGTDIRVVNMSNLNPPLDPNYSLNGDALLTQFIDWSASANDKDILHVISGYQGTASGNYVPSDNFNGMTIAYSVQVNGVWRKIGSGNNFTKDAYGDRTSISLIAPGFEYQVTNGGSTNVAIASPGFTSYAAPQVAGAAALLQHYAEQQFDASNPRFDADARRHEVMKAVLMNSADKLIDNNTVMVNGNLVPQGGLLGMTRTVVDKDDNDWLASEAYNDGVAEGGGAIPLDDQMGAGHLNVTRAVQQFKPGEYESDSGDVPTIAWDYGHTTGANDFNRYPLAGTLTANHFISITLAWDRHVQFLSDANMNGKYDIGDTFKPSAVSFPTPDNDDLINNLDLFLMPKGAATLGQAIAESTIAEGTVQHIFFQLPTTDEYEIWVRQFDQEMDLPTGQDYALAWWYGVAPALIVQGDYNGDTIVNVEDYTEWRGAFGGSVAPGTGADGNGNGVIDGADYVIWRKNLGAGSGSLASVPEPGRAILFIAATVYLAGLIRCKKRLR